MVLKKLSVPRQLLYKIQIPLYYYKIQFIISMHILQTFHKTEYKYEYNTIQVLIQQIKMGFQLNTYYPSNISNDSFIITISRWGILSVIIVQVLLILLLRLITILCKNDRTQCKQQKQYNNTNTHTHTHTRSKTMTASGNQGIDGEVDSGFQMFHGKNGQNKERIQGIIDENGNMVTINSKTAAIFKRVKNKITIANKLQCREQRLKRRQIYKANQKKRAEERAKIIKQMKQEQEQPQNHNNKQEAAQKHKNKKKLVFDFTQQDNQFNSEEDDDDDSSSSQSQPSSQPQQPKKLTLQQQSASLKKTNQSYFYPYIKIRHLVLSHNDYTTTINMIISHSFIGFMAVVLYFPFLLGMGIAVLHLIFILFMIIVSIACMTGRAKIVCLRICTGIIFVGNLLTILVTIFAIIRSNPLFYQNVYQL